MAKEGRSGKAVAICCSRHRPHIWHRDTVCRGISQYGYVRIFRRSGFAAPVSGALAGPDYVTSDESG